MLFGFREGERYIDRKFVLSEKTGFSAVYWTTDSRVLSIEFGLRLGEPPSSDARRKIRLARLFMIGSLETNRVNEFFLDLALKGGWFAAVPYHEIPHAKRGLITERDLETAVQEGFLQRVHYPGVEPVLAELTTRIIS